MLRLFEAKRSEAKRSEAKRSEEKRSEVRRIFNKPRGLKMWWAWMVTEQPVS